MTNKVVVTTGVVLAVVGVLLATRKASALPSGDILLSDFRAEPPLVYVGESVIISITIKNLSSASGLAKINIGGDIMAQINVTLNPGESKTVQFTFVPPDARTYIATVDGLSVTFTAVEPPAPNIVLSNLVVYPTNPYVGETVVISVTATNNGGAPGTKTITLNIN